MHFGQHPAAFPPESGRTDLPPLSSQSPIVWVLTWVISRSAEAIPCGPPHYSGLDWPFSLILLTSDRVRLFGYSFLLHDGGDVLSSRKHVCHSRDQREISFHPLPFFFPLFFLSASRFRRVTTSVSHASARHTPRSASETAN